MVPLLVIFYYKSDLQYKYSEMKKTVFLRSILPVLVLITISSISLSAQSTDTILSDMISHADAEGLYEYFDESVDLGLPEADQDYGKNQALMVMKDFFKKYPPKEFKLQESGQTSENNMFLIGNYLTGVDSYKLLVMLRKVNEDFFIHKMKFEKTDPKNE